MKKMFAIAIAIGLQSAASAAQAPSPRCRPVDGHSATILFGGPSCPSPVGLCTTGSVTGAIHGQLDVVVSKIEPADASVPTVVRFIGQSTITMDDGSTLIGTDVGAIDQAGDGHVGTLLTWTSGSVRYAGASGHIVINGNVDFIAGTVHTQYRGEVCLP